MKVLINRVYGGFGFSDEFKGLIGIDYEWDVLRHDQELIQKVEEFGLEKTSGLYSVLEIVEVPDGCEYSIHEYDGSESINETWITVTQDELINGLSPERLELALKVSCIRVKKSE
jgi:hypothetical protein